MTTKPSDEVEFLVVEEEPPEIPDENFPDED